MPQLFNKVDKEKTTLCISLLSTGKCLKADLKIYMQVSDAAIKRSLEQGSGRHQANFMYI